MIFSKKFFAATENYGSRNAFVAAPMFRRNFIYTKGQKAELTICGLGFYELYINGENVTKGKFAPYISNPDDLIYYDHYVLTEKLNDGKNAIGLVLGNGFLNNDGGTVWQFDKAAFRSAPKFALAFELDGRLAFEADEHFRWIQSPIMFDDYRIGEYYDARMEIRGWCLPDYDDSTWKKPIAATVPKGEPQLCAVEPIRCSREICAVKYWKSESGYVFDFGENLAGTARLKIQAEAGTRITFQHGETLLEGRSFYNRNLCCPEEDRNRWQTDVYICAGRDEPEIYEPHFTYHGFRYVFVEGIADHHITDDLLTMRVYHSDFKNFSLLETDNTVINKIQRMTMNSNLSNFFYFITDCPQREKNGWTGDTAVSAEQMLLNFDCANSLREWLKNFRAAQRADGALPAICPTTGWGFEWGNGPAWDMALIESVYQLYRFTGDRDIIRENKDAIVTYLSYMRSKENDDGLYAYGLPDWCECLQIAEHVVTTPLEVTDTLICIEMLQKAASLFQAIGEHTEANLIFQKAQRIITAFRRKYLEQDLYISCHSQTAQAKAISVGVFAPDEEHQAVENLVQLVEEKGHFQVGILGARVLFRVLSDYGYDELAYKLITQDRFPSYKGWIDQGFTALGECFNEQYPNSCLRVDGGRVLSHNHHFFGDVSGWFFRYILGLEVNPNGDNPNCLSIKPHSFQSITKAHGQFSRNGNLLEWVVHNKNGLRVDIIKNIGFEVLQ